MNTEKLLEILERTLIVFVIFSLGILVGATITGNFFGLEMPNGVFQYEEQSIPSDRISEDNIQVLEDKIIISIDNPSVSRYANTNSMIPINDEGANGIRIVPQSEDEISVGDIITFEEDGMLIVHRVTEIGQDEQGKYFITKGDNNAFTDGKIRFDQIRYLTIGVLY